MFFNEKTSNHRCGVAPTSSTPSRLGVSLDVSMMSWIIVIFRRTRRSARRRGRSRRTAAARWTVRATGRRRRRGTSSPSPPTSSATRSRCLFSLSSFKQTNDKQQTNRRRQRRQRVNRISSDKCLGLVDVVPRHGIPMTCPVSLQKEKDVIVKRDTVVATNPNWVLLRSAVGAEDGRPMSELYFFFILPSFVHRYQVLQVPHTASVKQCHRCRGAGSLLCQECHGKGWVSYRVYLVLPSFFILFFLTELHYGPCPDDPETDF